MCPLRCSPSFLSARHILRRRVDEPMHVARHSVQPRGETNGNLLSTPLHSTNPLLVPCLRLTPFIIPRLLINPRRSHQLGFPSFGTPHDIRVPAFCPEKHRRPAALPGTPKPADRVRPDACFVQSSYARLCADNGEIPPPGRRHRRRLRVHGPRVSARNGPACRRGRHCGVLALISYTRR